MTLNSFSGREDDSPTLAFETPVLAYATGAELKPSIVLDQALCSADADGNKYYDGGQVLGKVTATGKYSYYDPSASDGRATAKGVLVRRVSVGFGDAPGAMYSAFAAFNVDNLIGYAGNEAAVQADLPNCEFLTVTRL
jgi:hypothetical protein